MVSVCCVPVRVRLQAYGVRMHMHVCVCVRVFVRAVCVGDHVCACVSVCLCIHLCHDTPAAASSFCSILPAAKGCKGSHFKCLFAASFKVVNMQGMAPMNRHPHSNLKAPSHAEVHPYI